MSQPLKNTHAKNAGEVLDGLHSSLEGLSAKEAERRLEQYGKNVLEEARRRSLLKLYIGQFKNLMVLILIPVAGLSLWLGHVVDFWVVLFIIFADTTFGFFQEYKAEQAINTLRRIIVKTSRVFRDHVQITIPSEELVPGDIIILEEGDTIGADARIIEAKNCRVVEASLTGESLPVEKHEQVVDEGALLADQDNMLRSGTIMVAGYARAVVVATAEDTAIGSISRSLDEIKIGKTNFIKKTNTLVRQMSVIAVISALIMFCVGYFIRHYEIDEILMMSLSALVAAIPESLPALITVVLAIGARRMSRRNMIVRDFTSTETLGEVSTILTDKTGTLTRNELTVKKVFIPGLGELDLTGEGWSPDGDFFKEADFVKKEDSEALACLLKVAAVSNNAEIYLDQDSGEYELSGDPTEGALNVMAQKGGVLTNGYKDQRVDDLPFNSVNKLRATLLNADGTYELHVTGAPEVLLNKASHVLTENGTEPLTEDSTQELKNTIEQWSNNAMRVIALAYKKQTAPIINEQELDGLIIVGIVGMIDPPRKDAMEAVQRCKDAGIRVVMVTGDHLNTALSIAYATNIVFRDKTGSEAALSEQQLNKMTKEQFDEAITRVSVFARLSPGMKLRIANRLQAMGQLIAMTGDGVNDAPALKQADVGVSMGIMGTDMARESSNVVLADDNFATIVNAVEEGRIVFTNSRNASFFLITTNIAESVTLVASILMGLPLLLTATQLLWLNIITDGVTDTALATEPGHREIMKQPPRSPDEKILNRSVVPHILINVIIMSVLTISAFYLYKDDGIEKARTVAFVVMSFTQLFNVYNLRSLKYSLFEIGIFTNKYINWGVGLSAAFMVVIIQVPVLASLFHFVPLSFLEYVVLFGLSSLVFWAIEMYKLTRKQKNE